MGLWFFDVGSYILQQSKREQHKQQDYPKERRLPAVLSLTRVAWAWEVHVPCIGCAQPSA